MDIVLIARLLIPIFTLIIGIFFQYLLFYESGMSFFSVISKMFFLWILYTFLGMIASEHILRLLKRYEE